jgi:ABC-type xylose transport system permease subunit
VAAHGLAAVGAGSDVETYWQMIVKGLILTLAVWVDVATRANRR